jgi:uncharacterized protein
VIRVVVDPGVLISALLSPAGAPAGFFVAWREGLIEIMVCPALLEEIERVLARPQFRPYVTQAEADAFVGILRREATTADDPAPLPGATPDPGDDYLVALARSTGARFLVSGDAHLTGFRDAEPPVLTPRQLLDRLETAAG